MSDTHRGNGIPDRGIYPGLVRPYADDADYVNQPKFVNNKTLKTSRSIHRQCSDNDPFSIYDDESAHDHYFFLPAGKVEITNFKQQSPQRVSTTQRERCGTWSRTKPPDPEAERVKLKSTISDTASHCQCVSSRNLNKLHSRNCRGGRKLDLGKSNNSNSRNNNRTTSSNTVSKDVTSGGGDYCSLSLDSVSPHYPGTVVSGSRNATTPIDQDSFREFALSLVRTTNNSSERNENMNDYYDPAKIDTRSSSLCDSKSRDEKSCPKLELDKCIDHCTCMICVKAGRYHWAGDKDTFIEEPCNCLGGRKNIVRRWLCMGVLALFLPCLICYLPAKLCQNSCASSNCPQTKLKDKQCLVRYVSDRNVKHQDEGLL